MVTSLEHGSAEHALNRVSSRTGDGDGNGGVVEAEAEAEVEVEVSFGLAVTTDEEEGVKVVVGDERGRQRIEHTNKTGSGNENGDGDGGEDDRHCRRDHVASGEANRGGMGSGSGSGSSSEAFVASLRQGSASRTRSGSHSHSNSNSRSQSRSSVREGLEMGKSSVATSWTQAERDGDVGGRPSGEAHCRSSVDRVELNKDVGEGEAPRGGSEVVSPSYLRTNAHVGTDVKDGGEVGGDVPRREEVLVVQEEDIGEGWDPLRYNGKARLQDHGEGEGEKGEGEEDMGCMHTLESIHGGDQSLEMNEEERGRTLGSSGRNTRRLHLEFKRPSPQPWDEIDPPTDNNETYTSDFYSTLNSKTFGTLQKRCVRWCFAADVGCDVFSPFP